MAHIIENFINPEIALEIKKQSLSSSFKHSGKHPETNKLQWENLPLYSEGLEILHPYLKELFDDYNIDNNVNFQRCYVPFGIHHDSKKRHNPSRPDSECIQEGFAILIPMDEATEFNTVFWKEKYYDNDSMVDMFMNFGSLDEREISNNKLGEKYDLDFCWDDPRPTHKIYNHLDLDCVFNWKIGNAAVFDRMQLHSATDFTKKHPYKDAITIFFN